MPDWSRRSLLQTVATTGALGLAGCSGESSVSNHVPADRGDPVADIEVTFVRDGDGGRLFTVGDGDDRDAGRFVFLADADDRERVTFRSTPPAADLRAFVDATDLGASSVYLLERPVGECYRVHLVGVYRDDDDDDGVRAEFCSALRPADVACSAETEDTVGIAIRLPFDGDDIHSRGGSWGRDCRRRPVVAREGGDS